MSYDQSDKKQVHNEKKNKRNTNPVIFCETFRTKKAETYVLPVFSLLKW